MRDSAYEAMKAELSDALRLQFRPEFLNRIDEIIVFHALTEAELAAIVDLLLADLSRRLAGQDLVLELTPAARALIAREGHDPAFGARPLKRTIQRLVENPLARALLQGQFKPGDRIIADADPVGGTLGVLDRRRIGRRRGRRSARCPGLGLVGTGCGRWSPPRVGARPARDRRATEARGWRARQLTGAA